MTGTRCTIWSSGILCNNTASVSLIYLDQDLHACSLHKIALQDMINEAKAADAIEAQVDRGDFND